MIYGKRSNGHGHGTVLTKALVVDAMLDRVGYTPSSDLSQTVIIEPAAGDGAFAIPIIKRLYMSSQKFGFSFQKALSNIRLYEIDAKMTHKLTKRVEAQLREFSAELPLEMIQEADFLLANPPKSDLIIGNPPYVRHENIPVDKKNQYRKLYKTFKHRSDLYIAFYEKGLRTLNNNGELSFICSNRWLKNQYGQNLRELIGTNYSLKEIIDLEETQPFEENVIAYPAITTIQNSKKEFAYYYWVKNINDLERIDKGVDQMRIIEPRAYKNWFPYSSKGLSMGKNLESIVNQGFKIGIGVATGADKVFIRDDFRSLVEEELLLPMVTSKDLRNERLNWSGNLILNPYANTGALIDLDKYPKAKEYLSSRKDILLNRHISKKFPSKWYKTIDKITPTLTYRDKILLPDISGNSCLLIDRGNFYPHHNLYYITGRPYNKLVILAAVLMSDFIKQQLLNLGTKMNGGYPRWQSQNLKKLSVPIVDAIPEDIEQELIQAYQKRDYDRINELINPEKIANYEYTGGQASLFEPKAEYSIARK